MSSISSTMATKTGAKSSPSFSSPRLTTRSPEQMAKYRFTVEIPQNTTVIAENIEISVGKVMASSANSLQALQQISSSIGKPDSKKIKASKNKGSDSARGHDEKSPAISRTESRSGSGSSSATPTFVPARPASAASKTPGTPSKSHSNSGSNSNNSSAPSTPKTLTAAAAYAADALRKVGYTPASH